MFRHHFLLQKLGQVTIYAPTSLICKIWTLQDPPGKIVMRIKRDDAYLGVVPVHSRRSLDGTCAITNKPILLLRSPFRCLRALDGVCCLCLLFSSSLLASCTPKSAPRSRAPPGAQRPHSPAARPLARSWGTLPGDLATPPFARAKRGLLFPAGPRGSRPNPANYRPHGGGARARPPLSHGREESPSVRRREQSRDSAAPAPRAPRPPLSASSALLSSVSLCLWVSGAASPTVSLSDASSFCSCPSVPPCFLSPSPSPCLSAPRFFSIPCISPMIKVPLASSPMDLFGGSEDLTLSLLSFLGTPGSWLLLSVKKLRMLGAQGTSLAGFGDSSVFSLAEGSRETGNA